MANPNLIPQTTHCCVLDDDNDKRRSSCCSYCNNNKSSDLLNPLELKTLSLTPPLDNVYFESDQDQPFSCIYLLNLFLAPDMTRYLKETSISDDIYNLPIHLQKLVCEARMEVLMISPNSQHHPALKRLEKVRAYISSVADHDIEAIIATLNELVHDEDELSNILGE